MEFVIGGYRERQRPNRLRRGGRARRMAKTAGIAEVCTRKCKLFSLTIKPLFAVLVSTFGAERGETRGKIQITEAGEIERRREPGERSRMERKKEEEKSQPRGENRTEGGG